MSHPKYNFLIWNCPNEGICDLSDHCRGNNAALRWCAALAQRILCLMLSLGLSGVQTSIPHMSFFYCSLDSSNHINGTCQLSTAPQHCISARGCEGSGFCQNLIFLGFDTSIWTRVNLAGPAVLLVVSTYFECIEHNKYALRHSCQNGTHPLYAFITLGAP
jgi:hypothetical protein